MGGVRPRREGADAMAAKRAKGDLASQAQEAYRAARDEAATLVEAAARGAAEPPEPSRSELDEAVVQALRREDDDADEKVAEAEAQWRAAAWLPEAPSLTAVLLERGDVDSAFVRRVQQAGRGGGGGGQQDPNVVYARMAVQLGHLSRDQARESINELPTSKRSRLLLPTLLVQRGLITQEAHKEIAAAVKKRAEGG